MGSFLTIGAVLCFALCALTAGVIGAKYLTLTAWMPYHEVASAVPWTTLSERMQLTVQTMLRVAGAGMVTTSVATLLLLAAWSSTGHLGVLVFAGIPVVVFAAPVLVAAHRLKAATGARTPVVPAAVTLGLAVLGMLLATLVVVSGQPAR